MPTARDLLAENPYTPTSTLAQAIMHASPLLSELVVVREWLQDSAPPPQHPEATTGYWKFTKHSIMQSLRLAGGGARDGLVKEMDPDAVNRGDGRMLASDDTVSSLPSVYCTIAFTTLELRKRPCTGFILVCARGAAGRRY
jgi:nuclear pore complex protein Nup107